MSATSTILPAGRGKVKSAILRPRSKRLALTASRRARIFVDMYRGWWVVACAFLIAVFGWGFGFYGIGVFLAELVERRGWSTGSVASAVTVLYLVGAALIVVIAGLFERVGPRVIVLGGMTAMGTAAIVLTRVTQPWQLYVVFPLMAAGWAAMSGAALNLIVAPWFERRRGLAISLAFNGAAVGGVVLVPALVFLIHRLGFTPAVATLVGVMAVTLTPLVLGLLARGPEAVGLGPDGDSLAPRPVAGGGAWRQRAHRPRVPAHRAFLVGGAAIHARPHRADQRDHPPGVIPQAHAGGRGRRLGGEPHVRLRGAGTPRGRPGGRSDEQTWDHCG